MTKKLALLGGIVILAAALAVPALAGRGGGWDDDHMRGYRGWDGGHMMGSGAWDGDHMMGSRWWAGLSQAQQEELAATRLKFYNETLELRRQAAQKGAELQALMLNPEATDEALQAKLGEVNDLRAQLSQKQFMYQREIQKRFPELGMGRGWGRGGRGPDRDFCGGRDRDRDPDWGYCR